MFSLFQKGDKVGNVTLIISVEHHHVVVPVLRSVAEGHFVGATQRVIFAVAYQNGGDGKGLHGFHGCLTAAVGTAVVHHQHAGKQPLILPKGGDAAQYTGDLLFTIVHGDEDQDLFHTILTTFLQDISVQRNCTPW